MDRRCVFSTPTFKAIIKHMDTGQIIVLSLRNLLFGFHIRLSTFKVHALGIQKNMFLLKIDEHPGTLVAFKKFSLPHIKRGQLDYLSSIFQHPITHFETRRINIARNLDWLKTFQGSVENLNIVAGKVTQMQAAVVMYQLIKSDVDVTRNLKIDMDPDRYYAQFPILRSIDSETSNLKYHFTHGNWISLHFLSFLNARFIEIENSCFPNIFLNMFFRVWRIAKNCCRRYEVVTIHRDFRIVPSNIMMGLKATAIPDDEVHVIERNNITVTGGFKIFRRDGQAGIIKIEDTPGNGSIMNFYVL